MNVGMVVFLAGVQTRWLGGDYKENYIFFVGTPSYVCGASVIVT